MNRNLKNPGTTLAAVALIVGALVSGSALAITPIVSDLIGAQEVPPVKTLAKGTSTIVVGKDKSISGNIRTQGMKATAAHIHQGPTGMNGPHIIDLVMTSPDEWAVPRGAKLTEEQFQSLTDGNLYVNVHSDNHKGGEIRAQLKP